MPPFYLMFVMTNVFMTGIVWPPSPSRALQPSLRSILEIHNGSDDEDGETISVAHVVLSDEATIVPLLRDFTKPLQIALDSTEPPNPAEAVLNSTSFQTLCIFGSLLMIILCMFTTIKVFSYVLFCKKT